MYLSQAAKAFLRHKQIAGLSPNTIRNYRLHFKRLQHFLGEDVPVDAITRFQIKDFLWKLQTAPPEVDNTNYYRAKPLGPKSIKNTASGLSSFFTWAVQENLVQANPVDKIELPAPQLPDVSPYTRAEVNAFLAVARTGYSEYHSLRDAAIILFLLDTGVRSTELCRLTIKDADLAKGQATVWGKGRRDSGKGKNRTVPFSRKTRLAISRYLTRREATGLPLDMETPLFMTDNKNAFSRDVLYNHIVRLSERAGVRGATCHRFRHTFAIEFLRNGGNIYALQKILGHSSLDMVKRYLKIAQSDIDTAHRHSSPVDNWGL